MSLRKVKRFDQIFLLIGIITISIVFIISTSASFFQKEQVWEAKIFDSWNDSGYTYVKGHSIRGIRLIGNYNLKIGEFYHITYIKTSDGNVVKEIKIIE